MFVFFQANPAWAHGQEILVELGSALLFQVALGLVLGVIALRRAGIGGMIPILLYVVGAIVPWWLIFFESGRGAVAVVSSTFELMPNSVESLLFWTSAVGLGPLLYGVGVLLLKVPVPKG